MDLIPGMDIALAYLKARCSAVIPHTDKEENMNRIHRTLLYATFTASAALGQTISIGGPVTLYSNSQFPQGSSSPVGAAWEFSNGRMVIDASFATIKAGNGNVNYFGSSWRGLRKFHGPANKPLNFVSESFSTFPFFTPTYRAWFREHHQLWPNTPNLRDKRADDPLRSNWAAWIPSIYKLSNGHYLGFVHIEDFTSCLPTDTSYPYCYVDANRQIKYRIGIAYSTDQGTNWTYCGHVVAPKFEQGTNSNLGGIPFIVHSGYFYIYFNDYSSATDKRIAVARAPVADVVAAAQAGTVTNWTKYGDTNLWNQGGLTGGLGKNIIPPLTGNPNVNSNIGVYDSHSDAVYSTALSKFIISINVGSAPNLSTGRALLIYTSTNGVNWGGAKVVDNTQNRDHAYSTFTASSGSSDDISQVGNSFQLIYPLRNISNLDVQDLYWRQITIN